MGVSRSASSSRPRDGPRLDAAGRNWLEPVQGPGLVQPPARRPPEPGRPVESPEPVGFSSGLAQETAGDTEPAAAGRQRLLVAGACSVPRRAGPPNGSLVPRPLPGTTDSVPAVGPGSGSNLKVLNACSERLRKSLLRSCAKLLRSCWKAC